MGSASGAGVPKIVAKARGIKPGAGCMENGIQRLAVKMSDLHVS
jgi:hypothetical protein